MRYIIPINRHTLPLIAHLNGGLEPRIEKHPTYFVFDSRRNGFNDIINEATANSMAKKIVPLATFRLKE